MLKYLAAMLPMLVGVACVDSNDHDRVNGSVNVAAGQPLDDASTVNGAVHVAADAAVREASTVNGSITLGDRAAAASIDAVNGAITIGAEARVSGDVSTVNGAITVHKGADIAGAVANVNGEISLAAAHAGGGIRTVAGDVTVGADARVEGGIQVKKPDGVSFSFTKRVPRVVIGPGAVVQGALRFEREVQLYVSDRAKYGEVQGATPITYTGDQPPG